MNSHFFCSAGLYLKILVFFWSRTASLAVLLLERPELYTRSTVLLGSAFRGITMLKFITTKSVTVAAAAIIAVGMAIFLIVAPTGQGAAAGPQRRR